MNHANVLFFFSSFKNSSVLKKKVLTIYFSDSDEYKLEHTYET